MEQDKPTLPPEESAPETQDAAKPVDALLEPGIPDISDVTDKPETRLKEEALPEKRKISSGIPSGMSSSYLVTWIIGVLLSCLLWLVAENLVSQRMDDQSELRRYNAQRIIKSEIERIDRNFTVMGGLLNPVTGTLPVNSDVLLGALDPDIEQFYRLHRITLAEGQGSMWQHEPLVPVSAERQSLINNTIFNQQGQVYQAIVSYLPSKTHKFFVVPVSGMPRKSTSSKAFEREAMTFVMGRRVNVQDTGTGDDIFLVVTTWPDLLGSNYMVKLGDVQTLEIGLPKEKITLLNEKVNISPSALSRLLPKEWRTQTEELSHELGNQTLSTKLTYVTPDSILLLFTVPYLLLMMGLGVTWLVSANINQQRLRARELREMNRKLAARNSELQFQSREAQKLEATISRSQMNSLAIINAVHEVIFEVDGRGNFSFLNRQWFKLTGLTPEATLGKSLFDYVAENERAEQQRDFAMLVQGQKQVFTANVNIVTAKGELHPIELVYSMLRQDHNRELRVIGIMNSISERLAVEGRVAETERQFRKLWESAPIGMYQMTPQGRFVQANPAMLQLLGFDALEEMQLKIRNANIELYSNSRERAQFLQTLAMDEAAAAGAEFELKKRDGSTIWVAETMRVVRDEKGEIKFYEGSMNDITLNHNANMALQKAIRESDIANRAKTEFLSNIGHELRTPLNSIIGFSEILRHQALGPIENPNYVEYAGEILDSGKRLLKIINQILDIARIDARERQLNEGIVRIPSVLNSCFDLLRGKIEEKRLIITNAIPADIPDIIGEELAIRQIMFNLISNAVKFTPDGGRITVAHSIDPVQGCRISVSDTGLGLDDDEITRALTPFGMVEHGHARENYGIGLGLTMAKMLINLHEGELDIFSQKGVGTTVSIIIPPARVRERATRLAPSFGRAEEQPVNQKSVAQAVTPTVTLDSLAADDSDLPDEKALIEAMPEIFASKPRKTRKKKDGKAE